MVNLISLKVLTPEKTLNFDNITSIIAPAYDGYLGILPNHAPLLSILKVGNLIFKDEEGEKKLKLSGGYLKVENNIVKILTEEIREG